MNKLERLIVNNAKDVPPDFIPIGQVFWVEEVLGRIEKPDYYPEFLKNFLHRKIWQQDSWPQNKCFVKPADRHKRFTGFVTKGGWKGKKKGPLYVSETVNFVSEWRYYIANGKLITAKWGSGIENPPPNLDINWPENYCGAVDFGLLDNGKIALIEANSPFSCGWYDSISKGEDYVKWIVEGWEYVKNYGNRK